MKIIRTINGKEVEIDLTQGEMESAYRERERYYHRLDVEEWAEREVVDIQDLDIDSMIDAAQEILGDCDNYWEAYWSAYEEAYKEIKGGN